MTNRERFHAWAEGRPVDRLPRVEWATYWDKTIERWHGEGLPAHLSEEFEVRAFFGLDAYKQIWIPARSARTPQPAYHGAPIVRTLDEYEAIRDTLFSKPPVEPGVLEGIAAAQERGELIFWITLDGFFWGPRTLLGIQEHLLAFYDDPALMHRINADIAEYNAYCIEYVTRYATPDFMTFGEDLSYNKGPMLSRGMFDAFLAPYYKQVVPLLKRKGIHIVIDSDGDITNLIDWFKGVGADGFLPLERQAEVDIVALRRRYPDTLFIGAFDKMCMVKGADAMRAEFERLLPAIRSGRFIPSVDHQTPPGVSLNQYREYLKLLWEYTEDAGGVESFGALLRVTDAAHPGRAGAWPSIRRILSAISLEGSGDTPPTL